MADDPRLVRTGPARARAARPGVRLVRLDVDRRISTALRPLPDRVRAFVCRALGLYPGGDRPPAGCAGRARSRPPPRPPVARVLANARRAGPWTDAVVAVALTCRRLPRAIAHLPPVVRSAARRSRRALRLRRRRLPHEAARLARMPGPVREVVRRRERRWARRLRVPRGERPGRRPRGRALGRAAADRAAELPAGLAPGATRAGRVGPDARGREDRAGPAHRPVPGRVQRGPWRRRARRRCVASPPRRARCRRRVHGLDAWSPSCGPPPDAMPNRVHLLPAVLPDELMPWTASADVSFVGQPPGRSTSA